MSFRASMWSCKPCADRAGIKWCPYTATFSHPSGGYCAVGKHRVREVLRYLDISKPATNVELLPALQQTPPSAPSAPVQGDLFG